MRVDTNLKPCPFCGGDVEIRACDDEGNIYDHEYELGFWSGLGFKIFHDRDECPISAPISEFEGLGGWIYESRAEAEDAWNRRVEDEEPDTQERIDEDARKMLNEYWGCWDIACDECPAKIDGKDPSELYGVDNCVTAQTLDLLRRQRALDAKSAGLDSACSFLMRESNDHAR